MIQLTRRDLEDAYAKVSSAHRTISGHASTGEKIAEAAIQTVEVFAGAAGMGVLVGRMGAPHVNLGGHTVPLDLAGGVGLHAAAFFGLFGRYGEHVHNLADGVMAQYATRWGVGYGTHLREKAGLPRIAGTSTGAAARPLPWQANPQATAHRRAPQGRGPLTEAELAGIASQMR